LGGAGIDIQFGLQRNVIFFWRNVSSAALGFSRGNIAALWCPRFEERDDRALFEYQP
jgi:hypothetical protein